MIIKSPAYLALVLLLSGAAVWGQQSISEAAQSKGASSAGQFSANNDAQLAKYIRMALDGNPGLGQALERYRAALQRLPQVASLPDPMLGFSRDLRMPETRPGAQTTSVSISQRFPWFGTLSAQEQVAAKEAAIFREQYEAGKDQTVQQVKTAYYNLAYIVRAIDINNEDRLLLERYEQLAEARYQQGAGLQQAVVKLQAEITRSENTLDELKSRRVNAEASLNALLNRVAETPVPKVDLPQPPAVEIDDQQLYQTGRRNRPEILAALLGIERDEKRIEIARKDYWPSFTVGGMFMNMAASPMTPGALPGGMNVYSLNLDIDLPVHRARYDAEVAEASTSKAASMFGYQDTVNIVESSIRQIGFHLDTLREQMRLFSTTLIPQAQQSLQSAEAAYSTGSLDVLDLLDSERVLLDVRLGLAQLTSDYLRSLGDMERAIGAPFPEVKP